jgi:signal transduction histidine kinase
LDSNIEITCNVTEIFQVFVNLMANAIDAIEKLDERWVKIFVQPENGLIKIIFVDSGSGLPESIKKNLFRAFYTTKGLGKGTGLGLALCKKIIESHGGAIHVDSNQPNTTFVLTFKQNISNISSS